MDRQKTEHFWLWSENHQTCHGDRRPQACSCTSKTFWHAKHSFTDRGKPVLLNLTPELHNPIQILRPNTSWNNAQSLKISWKSCKVYAPAGHLYSEILLKFGKISLKFSVLWVLYPDHCTVGSEIWHGVLHAKFHPHRYNKSPLQGKKPQNHPLSNWNTGAYAQSAHLLYWFRLNLAGDNKPKVYQYA